MGEWRDTPLSEVADLLPGYAFKGMDFGVGTSRGVKIKDVQTGVVAVESLDALDVTSYNQERIKKYRLNAGDHLITMTGNLGRVATIPDSPNSIYLNQRVAKLLPKANVVEDFLLYVIKSSDFIDYCVTHADSETAQPNISAGTILEYEFSLPPEDEQRAIASVLSSLDAKIDLLHRQNKTLEAMAEALFRQWFLEGKEEGWEEVELGRFVDCVNGVSYKSSELNSSKTALVTLKNFARDGGFRLDGFKEFDGAYKTQHEVFAGDLAVAHTDITQDASLIGNPVLVVPRAKYDRLVISMDLVKVVPKENWCSKIFLYHLMRTGAFKEHAVGYSNGSTVLHLSKKAVPEFEFLLPPKEKVARFTEVAEDLHRKKDLNIVTIDNLTALRDTLLPKLMSGEVRVNESNSANA
jgi:type I restriction enzyme S subunit